MMNEKIDIPVWEKYTLTIEEASRYFTIGQNKLRRLVEENRHGDWYVMNGNRILIKKIINLLYKTDLFSYGHILRGIDATTMNTRTFALNNKSYRVRNLRDKLMFVAVPVV